MSSPPKKSWRNAEARAALLFLAPGLSIVGVFFLIPVVSAFLLAFTDFDIYALADAHNVRLVGLSNFAGLLKNPVFWTALRNTLFFVLVGGPLTVLVSLSAALLLDAKTARWKGFFRTVYFAPFVTTLVAVATVFRFLYHPRFGLLNQFLRLLHIPTVDWLGDPRWAMPAIVILAVWKNFGYNMIVFIAGLQNIPESLYEAARLDGAGGWRRFRHITVPMLAPTFLFVGVITMIGYFQLFAEPYVMTRGGPLNATLSMALFMYQQGFRWWNMGYSAAIAFFLFLLILAATIVQFLLQRTRRA
ncbi:MAG: sugar ABC transporter permease [Acidobacteriota bacterium]|nr:sugar ABC transporter permease [Acidobacteriota bacterium]